MFAVDATTNRIITKLAHCCSIQNGYPFKSQFFNHHIGIPLIRVRSLKGQNCDIYYNGPYDESYLVNNGDLLIGMDGDFQPSYWRGGQALLNQRVCRLINLTDQVDPYYLYQALKKPLQAIENATHFTTVKHLSSFTIQEIHIPLPSLPQQRAIAHILQTAQQAIHTRHQELELEHERKAALLQHLLTHGTSGEKTKHTELGEIPASWPIIPFGHACQFLQYGTSAPSNDDPSGLPVLRIPNVINGHLDTQDLKFIKLPAKTVNNLQLATGDLLFVRTNGNRAYAGRCTVFNGELPQALFASYLIRARLTPDTLLPHFAQLYMSAPNGHKHLSGKASTAADGKFNINTHTIKQVRIPVPPIPEQTQIINTITAVDLKIAALQKEITLHEELFHALLDELISGCIST